MYFQNTEYFTKAQGHLFMYAHDFVRDLIDQGATFSHIGQKICMCIDSYMMSINWIIYRPSVDLL